MIQPTPPLDNLSPKQTKGGTVVNVDNIKRKQYSTGKWYTRKEWEKDHKPTCDHYPCPQWSEVHWHI